MNNGMITIILAVLVIMQFDDFKAPSTLDYFKWGLLGIAIALNLIAMFRGDNHADQ
jgi:hypothetical protein